MSMTDIDTFLKALQEKDDASAISLLSSGRFPAKSVSTHVCFVDLSCDAIPILFMALNYSREAVVRALVERGADLDEFFAMSSGELYTAVGFAVFLECTDMIILAHSLGASMASVMKLETEQAASSALAMAIIETKNKSLCALLDAKQFGKALFGIKEMLALVSTALAGQDVIGTYLIVKHNARFDFKCLETKRFPDGAVLHTGGPGESSYADVMISCAQKSGSATLLRFVCKDLGLVGDERRVATADERNSDETSSWVRKRKIEASDLARLRCEACHVVGATKRCCGCKMARYCSDECQRTHLEKGGHKKGCKEIRRMLRAGVGAGSGCS